MQIISADTNGDGKFTKEELVAIHRVRAMLLARMIVLSIKLRTQIIQEPKLKLKMEKMMQPLVDAIQVIAEDKAVSEICGQWWFDILDPESTSGFLLKDQSTLFMLNSS